MKTTGTLSSIALGYVFPQPDLTVITGYPCRILSLAGLSVSLLCQEKTYRKKGKSVIGNLPLAFLFPYWDSRQEVRFMGTFTNVGQKPKYSIISPGGK